MTLSSHGLASSRDKLKPLYHYLTTTTVPMATKFGSMITYLDKLLPIKSHDLLIR